MNPIVKFLNYLETSENKKFNIKYTENNVCLLI